jgi:hypothetical protein
MKTPRRLDLVDLVRELTQTTQHRELYMRKRSPRYHVTTNPPLIVQLKAAATPNPAVEAGATRPAASKPSAAIDCIDTLNRIDQNATTWLTNLGHPDPGNVIRVITQLGALASSQDHCGRRTPRRDDQRQVICCTYHRIEADVRSWWSWARIATRWDLPPWQPDNTCPLCGTRGSLRIRLVDQLATCAEDHCRETWDHTTIGLLADHIRTENGETQAAS